MENLLRNEIERLRRCTTLELKLRYRELFGEDSPSNNRAYLFRRVAWRLQVRAGGDLSERARQRALQLADDADLRVRAPHAFWRWLDQKAERVRQRDPRLPPAGSELTRTYQGKTVKVQVGEADFLYHGRRYRSLSAIAKAVTGTRWNGYLFFGLKPGEKHG